MQGEARINEMSRNYTYYLDNYDYLVGQYDGKILVIKDMKIVGIYDDVRSAYVDSDKKYEDGTYIIQPCTHLRKGNIINYHTNVRAIAL